MKDYQEVLIRKYKEGNIFYLACLETFVRNCGSDNWLEMRKSREDQMREMLYSTVSEMLDEQDPFPLKEAIRSLTGSSTTVDASVFYKHFVRLPEEIANRYNMGIISLEDAIKKVHGDFHETTDHPTGEGLKLEGEILFRSEERLLAYIKENTFIKDGRIMVKYKSR